MIAPSIDGWRLLNTATRWTHIDIPGWLITENTTGTVTMTTPEGFQVTDRFGDAWQFMSKLDAYEFAKRAIEPEE